MPSCSKSCFRSEIGGRDIVQEQAAKIERLTAALMRIAKFKCDDDDADDANTCANIALAALEQAGDDK